MKKRLTITLIFSAILLALSAQNTYNSQVMKNFEDSLRDISASYYAYHRIWEDLSVWAH